MSWIATITCTQDPCTYCGSSDDRPSAITRRLTDRTFDTEPTAREFGNRMAHNVYGSSVHKVDVIEVGTAEELAADVLWLAAAAKRPIWFWREDQRIQRAINTLGITTEEAIERYLP